MHTFIFWESHVEMHMVCPITAQGLGGWALGPAQDLVCRSLTFPEPCLILLRPAGYLPVCIHGIIPVNDACLQTEASWYRTVPYFVCATTRKYLGLGDSERTANYLLYSEGQEFMAKLPTSHCVVRAPPCLPAGVQSSGPMCWERTGPSSFPLTITCMYTTAHFLFILAPCLSLLPLLFQTHTQMPKQLLSYKLKFG